MLLGQIKHDIVCTYFIHDHPQQSVSENRNPNYVDGGSDDSDVEEVRLFFFLLVSIKWRLQTADWV